MAINTNPYQNIYTTSGAGGTGVNTYYDVHIANPISHRMFSMPIVENNHYRTDDVTVDMLTRLQVYTSTILAGDIKTINQDYIHALQTIIYILKRAKTRVDEDTIERLWAKATTLEGNVVENYTNELLYVMGVHR